MTTAVTGPHPPPRRARVRPAARVVEREARFYALTWKGVAFGQFGIPILYLLALGYGLGDLVGARADLGGLDYLSFIAPGVLLGSVAQYAGSSSLWPVMAGHRWIGFHRAMVSTPIGTRDVVHGYLAWLGLLAGLQATVILVAATVMGGIDSWSALAVVPIAMATAAAVAAPLMAYAATCDSDRAFDPLVRLVLTPLYLFSGAFFPTSSLPAVLEWLQRLAPIWHGVSLARAATTGTLTDPWLGGTVTSTAASLAVVSLWIVGGVVAARHTFTRRLTA